MILIIEKSTLKYAPNPEQTPPISLFWESLYNLLFVSISFYFFDAKMKKKLHPLLLRNKFL
jgi:hypothetical protein